MAVPICFFLILLLLALPLPLSKARSADANVMAELKKSLKLPSTVDWSSSDPCQKWHKVSCDSSSRVIAIQIGDLGISGALPSSISNLTNLKTLELNGNKISGPIPSLAGLSSLLTLNLMGNQFTSVPSDFFKGMSSLQSVYLDNNPFAKWSIPNSLDCAPGLVNFSANNAGLVGFVHGFIRPNTFPSLANLHLSYNHLEGGLPESFSGLNLRTLWLNEQTFTNGSRSLGGSIQVLQSMTQLERVWLNMNLFTGPIPNLSKLNNLVDLNLRDNILTGIVPNSLIALKSLSIVNLTNNYLQGRYPKFHGSVAVDLDVLHGSNRLCLMNPGSPCDSRVDALISFMEPFNYPLDIAMNWKGNDPCDGWMGISCVNGNITLVSLQGKGLFGSISTSIAKLTSVLRLNLAHNNITGTIPDELASMPNLNLLDVSYNNLYGKVPVFSHTKIITMGNVDIGKFPAPSPSPASKRTTPNKSVINIDEIVGNVFGTVGLVVVLIVVLWLFCKKMMQKKVYYGPNDLMIEEGEGSGNSRMVISIQVLKNVTNNFSESNVIGKGGFGIVYKGEFHDGSKIAVKRMVSSGVDDIKDNGLVEFSSEIRVLTKVRHRNLVSLLGYCLDGKEKLLVYPYMPQGALSKHLFKWSECGLKPLNWKQRLTIALDVARGIEYLHNFAHQSFIHRDLKPSNILLGDDMRAKVSDFGLVRLAPNDGKESIASRFAGTFGYLAPEYAVMGRVTIKVDTYSFGVILMELITGRKALDKSEPEETMHLETWFRTTYKDKNSLHKLVDETIKLDEETSVDINNIAELACCCCARDPYQRPDMAHAVHVISSLLQTWKPNVARSSPQDDYNEEIHI